MRTYAHPIGRVWSAITDVDELSRWFPSTARIELRVGGTITFSDDPYMENSTGTVLACDPPRRLATPGVATSCTTSSSHSGRASVA